MNKTKKKRNSKNKSRKRIKGGDHSVTLYMWPTSKPDDNNKNNEMSYEFVEHKDTGSLIKASKRKMDRWIANMFHQYPVIPEGITPRKQLLKVHFKEKKK